MVVNWSQIGRLQVVNYGMSRFSLVFFNLITHLKIRIYRARYLRVTMSIRYQRSENLTSTSD